MAAFTTAQSGDWNDTNTWNEASYPQAGDTPTIGQTHHVTVTVDAECGLINGSGELTINAGVTLTGSGSIEMSAALTGDWGVVTINGTFILGNTFWFDDYSRLIIGPGGTLNVTNDIAFGADTFDESDFQVNGTAENRATIIIGGRINGDRSLGRQLFDWSYGDFTFALDSTLGAYGTNPVVSGIAIDHCTFNGSTAAYLRVGKWSGAAVPIDVTYCDFRDMARDGSYIAPVVLGSTSISTTGASTRVFSYNTVKQPIARAGRVALQKEYWEAVGNVFFNSGLNNVGGSSGVVSFTGNFHYGEAGSSMTSTVKPDDGTTVSACVVCDEMTNAHPAGGAGGGDVVIYDNNVFDTSNSSADVIIVSACDMTIQRNLFITAGWPINFGLGSSGTKLATRNTMYILSEDTNTAGASVGETSQSTANTTFVNNLVVANAAGTWYGIYGHNAGWDDEIDYTDYNDFINIGAGAMDKYYRLAMSGGKVEGDAGFGGNDLPEPGVDPLFHYPTRNVATWDASVGGGGTRLNAAQELIKMNGQVSGETADPAYTIAACLAWIQAGYVPAETTLENAGNVTYAVGGSHTIGAFEPVAIAVSGTVRKAMSMGYSYK